MPEKTHSGNGLFKTCVDVRRPAGSLLAFAGGPSRTSGQRFVIHESHAQLAPKLRPVRRLARGTCRTPHHARPRGRGRPEGRWRLRGHCRRAGSQPRQGPRLGQALRLPRERWPGRAPDHLRRQQFPAQRQGRRDPARRRVAAEARRQGALRHQGTQGLRHRQPGHDVLASGARPRRGRRRHSHPARRCEGGPVLCRTSGPRGQRRDLRP
jgi:hypothetical protein